MKIDSGININNPGDLQDIAREARAIESSGYAGAWTAEVAHDPFLPHTIAAEHTDRIELGTSIAVGFARNPMLLANLGHDLQRYSQGRFILGLGTQIKPHITKRFSMEWSRPAARMREMVLAIRAIWESWDNNTPLKFRGEFYQHTLMTPFFDPGPNPYGPPKIFISAVGPLMTEVAGEVCDGIICHSFSTEAYLRQVTLPALQRGLDTAGRSLDDFEISGPGFVVTGRNEKEMNKSATGVRRQIAFYASTPAYRPVLEMHGWGDLQSELNTMTKRGQWAEMGALIDDEMLDTFAIVGEPHQIADKINARWGDCVDRMSFYQAGSFQDHEFWAPILDDLTN
ncbi:MAG: LLM class F420-dependent oxidoreductase [Actinobacteria bacterium]|nr:LLM class F420-dependent oxidoreductase [Actinomycetota bacterium]MBT4655610.1 LLM class F420-dependent oxidoreductase [Actinomycetota bacterium]